MKQFEKAAVIGTGMMGPGIALTLATGGVEAWIVGRTAESAEKGHDNARTLASLLVDNGLLSSKVIENVHSTHLTDQAVSVADLVVESVPENMAMKQDLFAHWDQIAKPDAVLTSNTSSLSITSIASKCAHPERIVTTHFWNPPHLMKLVEIVCGQRSSIHVAEDVHELMLKCGKLPVIVRKDTPGQLGNRLQFALLREALHIVEEGIASVADVDTVVKNGLGVRMPVYGPFEHQDVVGLKTCKAVMEYVAPSLNSEPRAPKLIDQRLSEGRGFYEPGELDQDAARARRDSFVLEFMKGRFNRRGLSGLEE